MGSLVTTVTGWQHGVEPCASCATASFKVEATNLDEVTVSLITSRGEQSSGLFTAKQLYELATLAAQVLVAQSEARRASQS